MDNLTTEALEAAHKVAYLANEYPKKDMGELSNIFTMSPFDFNLAVWVAKDKGYFDVSKKGKVKIKNLPEDWQFGEAVDHLIRAIPYIFGKLAENKGDMEEEYFGNWTQGYAPHDVAIAIKYLENIEVIASYEVIDVNDSKSKKEVNKYIFYTLYENRHKRWGEKQFKDKKKLK